MLAILTKRKREKVRIKTAMGSSAFLFLLESTSSGSFEMYIVVHLDKLHHFLYSFYYIPLLSKDGLTLLCSSVVPVLRVFQILSLNIFLAIVTWPLLSS